MKRLIPLLIFSGSVHSIEMLCENNYQLQFDIPELPAEPGSGFHGSISVGGRVAQELIFTTNELGSTYRFKALPSAAVVEQLKQGGTGVIEFEETLNYFSWKTYRTQFPIECSDIKRSQ